MSRHWRVCLISRVWRGFDLSQYVGQFQVHQLTVPSRLQEHCNANSWQVSNRFELLANYIFYRRCHKQSRDTSNLTADAPYQISYHSMNHNSPVSKEKVLFKLTLTKSNAMEKTFRLVRGNEQGYFKVNFLGVTTLEKDNLKYEQVKHEGQHVAQLVTRKEIVGPSDFELELEVRINRNGKSERVSLRG